MSHHDECSYVHMLLLTAKESHWLQIIVLQQRYSAECMEEVSATGQSPWGGALEQHNMINRYLAARWMFTSQALLYMSCDLTTTWSSVQGICLNCANTLGWNCCVKVYFRNHFTMHWQREIWVQMKHLQNMKIVIKIMVIVLHCRGKCQAFYFIIIFGIKL